MLNVVPCECGFWDRDRPHSGFGGGNCEYAHARRTGKPIFNRDNSATIDKLVTQKNIYMQALYNIIDAWDGNDDSMSSDPSEIAKAALQQGQLLSNGE